MNRLKLCFFTLLLLNVACVSITNPLYAAPDHRYAPLNFTQTDTTSSEFKEKIKRLDSFYNREVRAGFNGSVLVGYKGQILYERYFGYCNYTTQRELCLETSSQLASTSKPFTATAILWLHQEKYLDIDKPVKDYLKNFPYPNITVTMLLNHRSGLPDYVKMGGKIWPSKAPMYNEDLLNYFTRVKPKLAFKPNTGFLYSNTNYAFLALIIEEVAAMHFKDFMQQFIFEPLGMENTYVFDPYDGHPGIASISYRQNWQIHADNYSDGIYGDKGIYSTVRDLYKWDQSFYQHKLLNPKTLKMAYSPYSFERPGTRNYGLGWRMINYLDGYKVIFHNGWWHGNNTVFYRFVDDDFTIIVLGNRYNRKIYSHSKTIYDIMRQSTEHAEEEDNENINDEWGESSDSSD